MTRKEWVDMLDLLNQMEIKGQGNIFIMYKIIAFIHNKISELDKSEQTQGG